MSLETAIRRKEKVAFCWDPYVGDVSEGTHRERVQVEAEAAGGSMAANQRYDVVDCWDTSLNQSYINGEEAPSATRRRRGLCA